MEEGGSWEDEDVLAARGAENLRQLKSDVCRYY
jgi:hypothetical protein